MLIHPATAFPENQILNGQVDDDHGAPVSGAVCTLQAAKPGILPEQGLSKATDSKGAFNFTGLLPGIYDLACAAVGHEPVQQNGIDVSDTQAPFVQVVLPVEVVIHQKVTVREKVERVTERQAAPPALISSKQIETLPLVQQKFKAALPLVPGVVRTPDGRINIKGTAENQGLLLVDSAETVDPVTGAFSINVPIDAVESVEVYKSAYLAEYGRFSGGLTTVQTKAPLDHWQYELNDFLPNPRVKSGHIVGIADDSPRLYFTGPLIPNKLNFSEALEYDLDKQPVRGLAYPNNEIWTEGVNSFTSFQLILSPHNLVTVNAKLFPMHRKFANINSLVPQPASSNYGQKGYSIGATDHYLFSSGGVLTSLLQVTRFDSDAYGQGSLDMIVTPDGWGGNFFNAYQRTGDQQELLEEYQFPRKEWYGKHDLKVGADVNRRSYAGFNHSHPILIRREDGTLAEQIDFLGQGSLSAQDTEAALFGQDHWAFNDQFAVDYGLRFSSQTIGEPAAIAPRLGMVYSPDKNGKTIFRSGVGIFYDRVPLLAADFTENPERSVTLYDALGQPLGPPVTYTDAYIKVNEAGQSVVPSKNRLDSTPYNLTWNFEVDQELRPNVVLRISYLDSQTEDQFIVGPQILAGNNPVMLLSNTGGSRYHEFETTLRVRPSESADLNFSYVRSAARGDLNTMGNIFVPFEQPVIHPDIYATLPSNLPNRFVSWAQFKMPWKLTVSPVLDYHNGFPYSNVDEFQNYAGIPNSERFPNFLSLDLKLTRTFRIPFLPLLNKHEFSGALAVFNLTNHSNPRDVYSNVTSPNFGQFVGFQHRLYELYLDIVH